MISNIPSQTPVRRQLPQFLTVQEVASMLRVSKMTVYRLTQGEQPELVSVRVGRSIRVPSKAFTSYLVKNGMAA